MRGSRRIAGASSAMVLALVLAGCVAPNSREACQVTKLAEVPIRMDRQRPVVELSVGDRPARMTLDSGASNTLITEAAFDRLGLAIEQQVTTTTTGAAGQTAARVSQPVAFTIGGLRMAPTRVASVPAISAVEGESGIDGLLGIQPLAGYDLDIDIPKRRLGLYAPRNCPDGPPPFDGPSVSYRSAPSAFGYLYAPAEVDGHRLSLVIDTGATRTYLDRGKVGLPAEGGGDRVVVGKSSGAGSIPALLHRFDTVTLWHVTRHNVSELTGPMPLGLDGLLGIDFLARRRVWLSFAGGTATAQVRAGE